MLNEFDIRKVEELKDLSEEQDERIFKLRKRLIGLEKSILGYSLETGDDGKER